MRPRPVLLISKPWFDPEPIGWALMITSAENAGWPDDLSLLERFAECGLPEPSVVRVAKLSTVSLADAPALGRLPNDLWAGVKDRLRTILAL